MSTVIAFTSKLLESFLHVDHHKITVNHHGRIICHNKSEDSQATSYGSIVIIQNSKGTHIWKFKILKRTTLASIVIGLDEATYQHKNCKFVDQKSSNNYGYCSNGKAASSGLYQPQFGEKYETGDIIKMKVDLSKNIISFSKNNNIMTNAFKIEANSVGYSMAVYTKYVDDSVELLSYNDDATMVTSIKVMKSRKPKKKVQNLHDSGPWILLLAMIFLVGIIIFPILGSIYTPYPLKDAIKGECKTNWVERNICTKSTGRYTECDGEFTYHVYLVRTVNINCSAEYRESSSCKCGGDNLVYRQNWTTCWIDDCLYIRELTFDNPKNGFKTGKILYLMTVPCVVILIIIICAVYWYLK